jgi:hypothetical protein
MIRRELSILAVTALAYLCVLVAAAYFGGVI